MIVFSIFISLALIVWGLWPDKVIQQREGLTDRQRIALKRQKFVSSLMAAVSAFAVAINPSPTALFLLSVLIGLLGFYVSATYLRHKVVYVPMGMLPAQIWQGNIAIIISCVMILMTITLILAMHISVPMFWDFYER